MKRQRTKAEVKVVKFFYEGGLSEEGAWDNQRPEVPANVAKLDEKVQYHELPASFPGSGLGMRLFTP